MPHPSRPFPGSSETPSFHPARDDAGRPAGGEQARGRPAERIIPRQPPPPASSLPPQPVRRPCVLDTRIHRFLVAGE